MTIEEEKKRIDEFFEKYGKSYDFDTLKIIKSIIDEDIERIDYRDVIRQVYSYLGILPQERDLYSQFTKYISDNYGLNKNIIEVGGGLFPTLAHHISKSQVKLNGGSITVYDKMLITEDMQGIKLYKQEFTLNTDISKYDLIMGMMPCDAPELIIKSAGKYDKEFVIAMCGCVHLNYPDYCYNDFLRYIESLANDEVGRNQNISIEYFPEEYHNPYPIISSKRKSLK